MGITQEQLDKLTKRLETLDETLAKVEKFGNRIDALEKAEKERADAAKAAADAKTESATKKDDGKPDDNPLAKTIADLTARLEKIEKAPEHQNGAGDDGDADAHKNIDPEKSVYNVISEGNELMMLGGRSVNARAYVSRFNFSGADQEKLVKNLSGGERNRLHLALTLKEEANVLLLDEPTNDIDVNTLRALEEGLEEFAGCAVVISHDRWFLDRIATHILAFEGDSQVVFFEGGYTDYEENRKKRLGDVTPHRVKYKKLIKE